MPAGMSILPGEEGCLTTSINIKSTTMLGKSRTKPRGMEMEELDFSFMRLLKKENLEELLNVFADFISSRAGAAGVYGTFFINRCTKLLVDVCFSVMSREVG